MKKDLGNIRSEYLRMTLEDDQLTAEPFTLLNKWFDEVLKIGNPEPTAMTLSTVEKDGQPSSRIVLLKKLESESLIFFTNYNSRKAADISGHVRVSALFFWPELERQVKVSGVAKKINDLESDAYFHSRPIESQIGAWASPQSSEVSGREFLEKEYEKFKDRFKDSETIPRPPHWGGYAIIPSRIEFWQGREARLHDRIEYRKKKDKWEFVRLAP